MDIVTFAAIVIGVLLVLGMLFVFRHKITATINRDGVSVSGENHEPPAGGARISGSESRSGGARAIDTTGAGASIDQTRVEQDLEASSASAPTAPPAPPANPPGKSPAGSSSQVANAQAGRDISSTSNTSTVEGDNTGQNVGVNYGTMNQTRQDIHNEAPNQGAQGTFEEPVTFNQQRGDEITAGRDVIQSGGDVTQVGGDYVGGDKISGDINARGVHGTGITIGHKSQNQVQQGGDADAFARAFAQVYQAINTRPDDPDVGRDEITEAVRSIEEEARKGDQANERKLTRWLNNLAGMAEDIFDVTVAALTGPQAAFATVARKVAAKAKQEREQE